MIQVLQREDEIRRENIVTLCCFISIVGNAWHSTSMQLHCGLVVLSVNVRVFIFIIFSRNDILNLGIEAGLVL